MKIPYYIGHALSVLLFVNFMAPETLLDSINLHLIFILEQIVFFYFLCRKIWNSIFWGILSTGLLVLFVNLFIVFFAIFGFLDFINDISFYLETVAKVSLLLYCCLPILLSELILWGRHLINKKEM